MPELTEEEKLAMETILSDGEIRRARVTYAELVDEQLFDNYTTATQKEVAIAKAQSLATAKAVIPVAEAYGRQQAFKKVGNQLHDIYDSQPNSFPLIIQAIRKLERGESLKRGKLE